MFLVGSSQSVLLQVLRVALVLINPLFYSSKTAMSSSEYLFAYLTVNAFPLERRYEISPGKSTPSTMQTRCVIIRIVNLQYDVTLTCYCKRVYLQLYLKLYLKALECHQGI